MTMQNIINPKYINNDERFLKLSTIRGCYVIYNNHAYEYSFADYFKRAKSEFGRHLLDIVGSGDFAIMLTDKQRVDVAIDRIIDSHNELEIAINEEVKAAELIRNNRADYENACDYLYYGYGFADWRKYNAKYINEADARKIWEIARDNMGNKD